MKGGWKKISEYFPIVIIITTWRRMSGIPRGGKGAEACPAEDLSCGRRRTFSPRRRGGLFRNVRREKRIGIDTVCPYLLKPDSGMPHGLPEEVRHE